MQGDSCTTCAGTPSANAPPSPIPVKTRKRRPAGLPQRGVLTSTSQTITIPKFTTVSVPITIPNFTDIIANNKSGAVIEICIEVLE